MTTMDFCSYSQIRNQCLITTVQASLLFYNPHYCFDNQHNFQIPFPGVFQSQGTSLYICKNVVNSIQDIDQ